MTGTSGVNCRDARTLLGCTVSAASPAGMRRERDTL